MPVCSKGPDFCGSACINFRKQTSDKRSFAEKKQLPEKCSKDNVQDSQPEEMSKQNEVLEGVVPRVLSDLSLNKIEQECCKENDYIALEGEIEQPEPLQPVEIKDEIEDAASCDEGELNKPDLQFSTHDDLVTREDGKLLGDDRLKIQEIKLETDSCPCSVYEIERSDDNNSTDVNYGIEDKKPISFVIKRWSCKNKCHCIKSKIDSSSEQAAEIAKNIESDIEEIIKEVTKKNSTQSTETENLAQEQRLADVGKIDFFKNSSKDINKTNEDMIVKCNSTAQNETEHRNLSTNGSTESKKNLMWRENTIEIHEEKDNIKILESDEPQKDQDAGSVILRSFEQPNTPVSSNEVLSKRETDSSANGCDIENEGKDNRNMELCESVKEIKILNETGSNSFTENTSEVIDDDKFTSNGDKNVLQTTDFNVQLPIKLNNWTRKGKEKTIIENNKCRLNKNSNIESTIIESKPSSNMSLKKSESCECTLKEFLKKLRFRDFF